MKIKRLFIFAILALIMVGGTIGCTTTDPNTGQVVYDPVTTENVKSAVKPFTTSLVRRVILDTKESDREKVASYFRSVGVVFCSAGDQSLSVSDIVKGANELRLDIDNASLIYDAKGLMVGLLEIWSRKNQLEMNPEKWPYHVCDIFCQSIDQALVEAEFEGVPK